LLLPTQAGLRLTHGALPPSPEQTGFAVEPVKSEPSNDHDDEEDINVE